MLTKLVVTLICAAALAGSAWGDNLGFAVDGTCLGGGCPAQALPFNGTASLPVDQTVTLTNGDRYRFSGIYSSSNDATGSNLLGTFQFQATYLGNANNTVSQTDILTIDLYSAFASTAASGNFDELLTGTFGQTVASTSSVQICTVSVCTAPSIPPGNFHLEAAYSTGASGGAFFIDNTITLTFGAGSPVGAYVTFGALPAGPAVNGVISASAFGAFATIAPGTWIEIYGSNLAAGDEFWAADDFNGVNAPTMIGGTTVTIDGAPAYVDYISPTQVNVQVPGGLSPGTQNLVVTTAGISSAPFPVTINTTEPGLLAPAAFKAGGFQYVVAQFADGEYDLPPGLISGVNAARAVPGDTVVLYGIGFGDTNPEYPPGEIAGGENQLTLGLTITIGGAQANVTYAGQAPGYLGLYQFNVVIPNIPANDAAPLTFTLDGVPSTQNLVITVGS